jgi:hypothetical protein
MTSMISNADLFYAPISKVLYMVPVPSLSTLAGEFGTDLSCRYLQLEACIGSPLMLYPNVLATV